MRQACRVLCKWNSRVGPPTVMPITAALLRFPAADFVRPARNLLEIEQGADCSHIASHTPRLQPRSVYGQTPREVDAGMTKRLVP